MKIIILDYQEAKVEIFDYNPDFGDAEEYMEELFKEGLISEPCNCHFMTANNLKLRIH